MKPKNNPYENSNSKNPETNRFDVQEGSKNEATNKISNTYGSRISQ